MKDIEYTNLEPSPVSYDVPNSAEPGLSPVKTYPERNYLGHRPYDRLTGKYLPFVYQRYKEVGKSVEEFGSGVIHLLKKHFDPNNKKEQDMLTKRNFPLGIYAANRPEWTIVEKAGVTHSLYSVALYDTLGHSSTEYIIKHAEIPIVVCGLDKVPLLLEIIDKIPTVKVIIAMDSFANFKSTLSTGDHRVLSSFTPNSIEILQKWARSKNIGLYDFDQVKELGRENPIPHFPPKPEDVYTLCYTSGTTGDPKSAIGTHANYTFTATTTAIPDPTSIRVLLSYLPLAHAYGRFSENSVAVTGGIVGYSCGDITKIFEDCQALQPTSFSAVPRLVNRFYDIISARTVNAPGEMGEICRRAVKEKLDNLMARKGNRHPVWDPLIFEKTRAIISNRLESIGCGTAPLDPQVKNFIKVTMLCEFGEGYGMTETSGIACSQQQGSLTHGNIGRPFLGVEIRLRDIPEMEFYVTDKPNPRGEILIRGPNIFAGYLKDKKNTEETLVGDGWLASGDVGEFCPDGNIKIINRKKNIFKLAQGEYVAPEKLENILQKHPLVLQSFVTGYPSKDCLVGIIVPDPETFVEWARDKLKKRKVLGNETISNMTYVGLTKNSIVNEEFVSSMESHFRDNKLLGYETLKAVHLEPTPFDVETNALLTPTLKLKRFDAMKYYKSKIDGLYASIGK
ncbi:Long chain acyl-CoA synthetase 7, peroxisomal [Zancudomyces culisetae]|uniref:Long chain acyl-CoA synthetase 7, peroxisomal n=1 Tax=Zancudomyces culisetae TaxID=1213189 RepID=A0A1R1PXJ0_ZANCU|nr:Long chain acyl-CoA synthetase 7, peroxisomal [Zancudomyces culisetae]|eukprot:OMH85669.1 Long chain acyl-CoA synthetase 7, peroxisomal [Zancudomyces culisetae]